MEADGAAGQVGLLLTHLIALDIQAALISELEVGGSAKEWRREREENTLVVRLGYRKIIS